MRIAPRRGGAAPATKFLAVCKRVREFLGLDRARKAFQSSSVVERSAVNRLVVGSNPTSGAIFEMFWTYVIQNPAGRFYIGSTDDLAARLNNHNRNDKILGKFTRKHGPWILAWSEQHATRSDAMRREREIKSWKSARMIRERLLKRGQVGESRHSRD